MKKLKQLVIVFVMFLSITSCENDNQTKNALFPVCKGESQHSSIAACESDESCKWGYINKEGEVIIDFQFNWADCFSEGLARVRIGDRNTGNWGFIDETGKMVIAPQFDEVSNFSEGLAKVQIYEEGRRKIGFINKNGEYIIEPKYRYAESFSEGLAVACDGNAFGFIDHSGNVVIDFKYDYIQGFSEGLAAVAIKEPVGYKWGFIDQRGDFVITPQFQYTKGFSEGLAAVIRDNKIGFVDKSGNMVIEVCDYDPQHYLGYVNDENVGNHFPSSWGYQINNYMKFFDGVACIRQPGDFLGNHVFTDSYTYYVDRKGKRISIEFFNGQNFSEGLAAVKEGTGNNNGKKYGYINEKSKLVIKYQFDTAGDFHNGLACVFIVGKMAYINKQGTIIWQEP